MKKLILLFGIIFIIIIAIFFARSFFHDTKDVALFNELMTFAEKGDAEAQYHIGMMYNNGIGVEKNPANAFSWFEKSAKSGFPLAQYKVGCYYGGQGSGVIAQNVDEELKYKLSAAQAGYVLAQNDVASIYFQDKKNPEEALKWLKAAADQGDAKSLYNLSIFYKDGLGGEKNSANAYTFFKLAQLAARGAVNENAQQALKQLSSGMSAAEIKEAETIVDNWKAKPTPLTIMAHSGIERARQFLQENKK